MEKKFSAGLEKGLKIGKKIRDGIVIGCVLTVVVGMPVVIVCTGYAKGMPFLASMVFAATIVAWYTIIKVAKINIDRG